jgi:hypothetical protein
VFLRASRAPKSVIAETRRATKLSTSIQDLPSGSNREAYQQTWTGFFRRAASLETSLYGAQHRTLPSSCADWLDYVLTPEQRLNVSHR